MKWLSGQGWVRWTLFGIAGSVAVVALGSDEDEVPAGHGRSNPPPVAQPHSRETSKPSTAGEKVEFERMLSQRRQSGNEKQIGNVFKAVSWYVPPPPPPPSLTPPQPTAPPLPFTYLGQYKDKASSSRVFVLANADKVYTVSEGDVIDGTYRVGAITSGQLEFTFLPLNIKQSLSTGGVL